MKQRTMVSAHGTSASAQRIRTGRLPWRWARLTIAASILVGVGYGCGSTPQTEDNFSVGIVVSDLRGAPLSIEDRGTRLHDGAIVTHLFVDGVGYRVSTAGSDSDRESVAIVSDDGKVRCAVGLNDGSVEISWSDEVGSVG